MSESNKVKVDLKILQQTFKALDQKHYETCQAYAKQKEEIERLQRTLKFANENLAVVEQETVS